MKYRPEIDGLRAVAVLPVILFHAGFSAFSGGYVGVDVFFVLSGYLITTLILREIEQDDFSIWRFYERRARRILPALIFVVVITTIFSWFWMLPDDFRDYSQSLLGVATFTSNFIFWLKSGYFDSASELKPLLHTWSLAVEEQYYIFIPLLLTLTMRNGRVLSFTLVAFLAMVSFIAAELGSGEANFYLIHSRFWELGFGSLAAFILIKREMSENNALALSGLVGIIVSIFAYDSGTPFPSVYTLLPVSGTVLIILFAGPSTIVYRVLSGTWIVGIGLISYSAYLWHQPIFALSRLRAIEEPGSALMLALSALSLCFAYLSWKYVEQPFRGKTPLVPARGKLLGVSTAVLASIAAFGVAGHVTRGIPDRLPEEISQIAAFSTDGNPLTSRCLLSRTAPLEEHPIPQCAEFMANGLADVVFVGDSHSNSISYQVQADLKSRGISSYAVAHSGCIGLRGFYRADSNGAHECNEYNEWMLEFARTISADQIVITSRFPLYFHGVGFDNLEGGVEHRSPAIIDVIERLPEPSDADDQDRINRVSHRIEAELVNLSKEFSVILIQPIPEAGWEVANSLARCTLFNRADCDLSVSQAAVDARIDPLVEIFSPIEVTQYSPSDHLCIDGRCATVMNHEPLYSDDNHLTHSVGALFLAPHIADAVVAAR